MLTAMVMLATTVAVLDTSISAAATTGDVVIAEILYKPDSGDGEFLEIVNASPDAVDVSGWSFSDGIDFVFPTPTSLSPGQRFVLAKDAGDFFTDHGFAPDGEFADGSLSNSADDLVLVDASGTVMDEVSYLDDDPWPPGPDDNGTSLELGDLTADNNDAWQWSESLVVGGTPGAVNGAEQSITLPTISALEAVPFRPAPEQPIDITTTIANATAASITYRLNDDKDVVTEVFDDESSPGGAGDGVYGITVPGQPAGTLVRFRVDASNADGATSEPTEIDGMNFRGVVVTDPARTSAVPIIDWWMPNSVYKSQLKDHRFDDVAAPAVLAYDGVVYDNATMRIRGGNSRYNRHVSWKVELPSGYLFEIPGHTTGPVDEFNLQGEGLPRAQVGWDIVNQSGFDVVDYFTVSSYRNGQFWGLGSFSNSIDGGWRDKNGYGDADVYKANYGRVLGKVASPANVKGVELKEGTDDDFARFWEFSQNLDTTATKAQYEYLLQHLDVPKVINYMALVSYLKHWDTEKHNFYLVHDEEGTGRWHVLPWDLNVIFSKHHGDMIDTLPGVLPERVLAHPEFRDMYLRRLRSYLDRFPQPDYPRDLFESLYTPIAGELAADFKEWDENDPVAMRKEFLGWIDIRADILLSHIGETYDKPIPLAQTPARPIVISEIHYSPSEGAEFVELTNVSPSEAFDLSGWMLDGVDLTIPAGTVLNPGASVVFVDDDAAFRESGRPAYVGGEFAGGLKGSGETLTLFDAGGTVVDVVGYGVSGPWPSSPNGGGPSLELIDLGADNDDPANWAPSTAIGGSPGAPNDPNLFAPPVVRGPGLVLNEYNGVAPDKVLKDDGTDSHFGTVVGNGGDWFELAVVEDGLDVRGWTLDWTEKDTSGRLVFADDPALADLPRGTIITVAEDVADDVTLDPLLGDWWINLQANDAAPGTYISPADFEVTNDDWQLTIVDADGKQRFGPAGEGAGGLSGVSSTEVARLEVEPSMDTTPASDYDDAGSSTFGAPNDTDDAVQTFGLRQRTAPRIVSGPSDAAGEIGDTVGFGVLADASAPAQYQWRRNGTDLPGETDPTLSVGPLVADDFAASFDVVVTNDLGSATSDPASPVARPQSPRIVDGLQALWQLDEGAGAVLRDTSGVGQPLDLHISDPTKVTWLPGGGIGLGAFVDISSTGPAWKLLQSTRATDEYTIEWWIDPAKAKPSRAGWLGGLIESKSDYSLALGQGMFNDPTNSVQSRIRLDNSRTTSLNGPAGSIDGDLAHVVLTRGSDGGLTLYVDARVVASKSLPGRVDFRNHPFRLGSAGPLTAPLRFEGSMFMAAVYNRALGNDEIQHNLDAGPEGEPPAPVAPSIVADPEATTVSVGSTAAFRVVADGTQPLRYQWRRDGSPIGGATTDTLTVGPVDLADDGARFDVVVSNDVGSSTSESAVLSVVDRPPGPPRAVFVAGNTRPPAQDRRPIAELRALGFAVEIADDNKVSVADVESSDLVLISSSVSPSVLGGRLAGISVPMLTWETYLYDEMGLSGPGNRERGKTTTISISAPGHPLAAGLAGDVTVYSSATNLSTGFPSADADVVATFGPASIPVLFGYEPGDVLSDGSVATAPIVGFFFDYPGPGKSTAQGWELFRAAVDFVAPLP